MPDYASYQVAPPWGRVDLSAMALGTAILKPL